MQIRIKNLRLKTLLGVHAWEHEAPREIIINAMIDYDATEPAASDNIKHALDYYTLNDLISAHVLSRRYHLVEKLVSELVDLIMEDKRVHEVFVEVDKPGAIKDADSVSISHSRKR